MVAWMNAEALQETVETQQAVYWSRSRQKLWRKGEESGHQQVVQEVRLDCDAEVILLSVDQKGGIACHTGRQSCFYRVYNDGEWQAVEPVNVLSQLHKTILERLSADADSSYVASLNKKGLDAILKKIGEEATETVMAAKDGEPDKIIYEVADLWFHTLVLLAQQGLNPDMVTDELARRIGTSGLAEKASRKL
ncbi:UNVERIFIED_CONTAM: hypothetical protein GTU68_007870 [Idotea baltica]|nr:hypothetical protein [Idotea baltica]